MEGVTIKMTDFFDIEEPLPGLGAFPHKSVGAWKLQ